MSSARFDPLGEFVDFQEAMNQVIGECAIRELPRNRTAGALGLAVDLMETNESFILIASVPGVDPDDVSISMLGDSLTISGQRYEPREHRESTEGLRWLIQERHHGAFDRTVKLPASVNIDAATADFANGLLTIVLPKSDRAKPRSIQVRGSSSRVERAPELVTANDES
jgi:HSP20 family protein